MRRRSPWFHVAIGSLAVVVLLAGAVAAWFAWWIEQALPLATTTVELTVETGSSPREIAQGWVDAGVQASPELIYQWFRGSGQSRRIRAGSYALSAGATPRSMLEMMVQGRETLLAVRLIEGWSLRQVRAALVSAPGLRPTTSTLSDENLMQLLGSPGLAAEGRFFPDTYTYSKGVSDLAVLRRAHQAMQTRLAAVWADRAADTPLKSVDEVLVLASIVEKETGRESDRGLVAGVFINRLRIGMPLQTDPTVIYGLGPAFDGNLRKRDLLADTPYNTYTRNGLPPTPIALPGMASLRAVVQPQPTRALYFVARGDGSSQFSETLAEHNRAVNRFQRAGGS